MIQRSIHYKSDFKLRLANEIDWSTPFKLRFFTTRPVSAMEVGYDGTTYRGCSVDTEGKLVVTFDRFTQLHRQGLGALMMELSYNIDDDQFADRSFDRILAPQKVVCIDDEDNEFELVLGLNGDSHVEVECSVIAAYKKGDPGDTPEIGENGNWWIGGVDTEVKADYSSEEALRQSQEAARVAAETTRQSNETQRQLGETTRQSNETTRQSKETERQTNETARQNAEAQRQQTFSTNEAARQTAYQNAEANRNGAYEEAEQDRDEEFASKEATRDAANQAALNCAETLAALGPKIGDRSFDVESATQGSYYALGQAVTIGSVYTGDTTSSSGYSRYPIITLLKGESISIAVLGGNGARAYCITDAETDKVLAKAAANLDLRQSPFSYTAEKKVKIYINDLSPYKGKVVVNGNIATRLSNIQPAVDDITEKLTDTETVLSETSVLSGYVIATDATLYQASSSSYKVHFFTITGGQYIKLSLRRSANAAATRLSVSFFSTQDDSVYTLVASNQITSQMRWVQNGGKALDFTIQSPVGANRIAVYGGDIESNVTSISVIALALTDINELARAKSRIINSMMEVESYPNNELSSRITNIEGQIYEVTQYGVSSLRSGYYYSYANLNVGDVFDGTPKSFSGTGWYILSPISLKKGSTIEVSTKGGTNGRAVCVTDASGVILELSAENADYTTTHYRYTATQDVIVYVNLTGNTTQFSTTTKESKIDGGGIASSATRKIVNPYVDIRNAGQLKVLDIGNSFTTDALAYLEDFITAAGINIADVCIYKIVRGSGSFKTFVKSWNNEDTYSGSTGCFYTLSKVLGGLTPAISGSSNYDKMHSAFEDVKWDVILIHQVSDYANDVNAWESKSDGGFLKEFIRIIKAYQPQAMIGQLWGHASRLNSTGGDTASLWADTKKGINFLQGNYGIDFVIPVATAIENIRASSANTSSHGLSRDNHHLGYGLARYVAAATYFQMLICGRYGGSVVGNTCTHTVTTAEHNDVSESYQGDLIDVTAENRQIAQIAAALACSDMFTINNPDGVTI